MPTYEYECECGHTFDDIQHMPGKPSKECPKCGKQARKIISRVTFRLMPGGVGWARDGYCKAKPKKGG